MHHCRSGVLLYVTVGQLSRSTLRSVNYPALRDCRSVLQLYFTFGQPSRSTLLSVSHPAQHSQSVPRIQFLLCTFRKKFQSPVLASYVCLSVLKCYSDPHRPKYPKIQFLNHPGKSMIFSEPVFSLPCSINLSSFRMLYQISPFRNVPSNFFMFQWTHIFPSVLALPNGVLLLG